MFEQATELDPNFALAYVKLSEAHRSLYFFGYDHTRLRIEKARKAVERALELQPKLPAAHVELGYYYYHGFLDYDKALKEFSIASKSLPNDNENMLWHSAQIMSCSWLSLRKHIFVFGSMVMPFDIATSVSGLLLTINGPM